MSRTYELTGTYEKDIIKNIGSSRDLILIGVRADADINHLNKRIRELRTEIEKLKSEKLKA